MGNDKTGWDGLQNQCLKRISTRKYMHPILQKERKNWQSFAIHLIHSFNTCKDNYKEESF